MIYSTVRLYPIRKEPISEQHKERDMNKLTMLGLALMSLLVAPGSSVAGLPLGTLCFTEPSGNKLVLYAETGGPGTYALSGYILQGPASAFPNMKWPVSGTAVRTAPVGNLIIATLTEGQTILGVATTITHVITFDALASAGGDITETMNGAGGQTQITWTQTAVCP
jgi:hypothetical protein